MKVDLKNIKTFVGRDGYGLNANLYIDNKDVAFVNDNADGSSCNYYVKDTKLFNDLKSMVETKDYICPITGDKMKMNMDIFIAFLCDEIESNKTKKNIPLQRWLNYKTY
jgi:hypothetical protein